jgi:hypothetical protein
MRKRFLLPYQIGLLFIVPIVFLIAMLGGPSLGGVLPILLLISLALGLVAYLLARLTKKRFVGDLVGYLLLGIGVMVFAVVTIFGTSDTTGWADLGLIATALMTFFLGMMSRGWMLVCEWWFARKRNKATSAE